MSEKEKQIVQTITAAVNIMPEEKRKYILGYAEGVIDSAVEKRPAAEVRESVRLDLV